MYSSANDLLLHILQFAISIDLESVLFLWCIVFFSMEAVNSFVMYSNIRAIPWFANMQDKKLLMLRKQSFYECGREPVAVVFAPEGCQYLNNGFLQPIGT